MKNTLLTLFILLLNQVNAQIIEFPDVYFKEKLVTSTTTNSIAKDSNGNSIKVDINNDGEIEVSEALLVYEIRTNNFLSPIYDFTGISYFQNLRKFKLSGIVIPSPTVFLDFTGLLNLEYIDCNNTGIQSLTVSGLTNLKDLHCIQNQLMTLDLTGLTSLEILDCDVNNLTTLDVSDCVNLTSLDCHDNQINNLNLSEITNLQFLRCYDNNITSLDLSNMSNLLLLNCRENQLNSLSFNNTPLVTDIDCSMNNITTLDFSSCFAAERILCDSNNLTNINIIGLSSLKELSCISNELTNIDFTGANNIETIYCGSNLISEIDISNLTSLNLFQIVYNNLTTLNLNGLSQLNKINCRFNNLSTLYIKNIAYNGLANELLAFGENPNLFYICTDEGKIPLVQSLVNSYGNPSCIVDASCSLSSSNFDMEPEITLFPNPASTTLNINSKSEINSVAIYNTLGQLVLDFSIKTISSLDVSSLKSGNYFLKINSTTGIKTERFIKE
ncbi:MAG: T9SS type A sorting domain-containing protein [Flavobacterium sp.]|uniref:T9SS type A sorting domain-containing protein n=1 Tax=Flavobacterium sp. TaxID=239 RepID=UPI0022BB69B3|nr:T9SS type A sorting domain-containing protein [Flavobacterium sp.]MCZ8196138.1 T9SS type A sorting domain-containing protein [Flavobacterium sp.]